MALESKSNGLALLPRGAFRSAPGAIGFSLFITFILALPLLVARFFPVTGEAKYRFLHGQYGSFPFISNEIYKDKDDIDLLFVSASYLWVALDTPSIRNSLEQRLGRKVRVLNFGTNWAGRDFVYMILKDVLSRHKVRMLVMSMNENDEGLDSPHFTSQKWWPYGEMPEATSRMTYLNRARLYAAQVLGAPRFLWLAFFPFGTQLDEFAARLGANPVESARVGNYFSQHLKPPQFLVDDLIYRKPVPPTEGDFVFENRPLPAYQVQTTQLIADLIKTSGTPTVLVNVPRFPDRASHFVREDRFWPEVFGVDLPLIGVPPAKLFQGLSESQVEAMYYNTHMNRNGNEYFTQAMKPALMRAYELYAKKN